MGVDLPTCLARMTAVRTLLGLRGISIGTRVHLVNDNLTCDGLATRPEASRRVPEAGCARCRATTIQRARPESGIVYSGLWKIPRGERTSISRSVVTAATIPVLLPTSKSGSNSTMPARGPGTRRGGGRWSWSTPKSACPDQPPSSESIKSSGGRGFRRRS
jgi:hypothetical protein